MLGLAFGWDGLSPGGSLGGRVCLSGFRGSDGGRERGGGAVGNGLVGWGSLSGGPGGSQEIHISLVFIHITCQRPSFSLAPGFNLDHTLSCPREQQYTLNTLQGMQINGCDGCEIGVLHQFTKRFFRKFQQNVTNLDDRYRSRVCTLNTKRQRFP